MKTIEQINEDIMELRKNGQSVKKVSDGYHTFEDYTDMRNVYFIALCHAYPDFSWKSKKHFNEENDPMFDGDFIAGILTPDGPITQHLKMKFWDDLQVQEIDRAPQYDGCTEEDVKARIKSLNGDFDKKSEFMISLEEYKAHLISVYSWPIDGSEIEIERRKKLMEKKYSDEYFEKIISDTNSFICEVLSSETIKHNYFKKEIEEDTTTYIYLDLHGGWHSDTLFVDDSTGRIISEYLMKKVFGNYLHIDIQCDELEDTSDEDILSYYYRYYIYMQGFPKNIDKIKEVFLEKNKQFVKSVDSNER